MTNLSERPKYSKLPKRVSLHSKDTLSCSLHFSDLHWCVHDCVRVCVWVPACLCVRGTGCLFCLPLSIAQSCPLLSQQRKEPRPFGPSLVYVCGVSFSWDFRTHPSSLLTQNILFYKIFWCVCVWVHMHSSILIWEHPVFVNTLMLFRQRIFTFTTYRITLIRCLRGGLWGHTYINECGTQGQYWMHIF